MNLKALKKQIDGLNLFEDEIQELEDEISDLEDKQGERESEAREEKINRLAGIKEALEEYSQALQTLSSTLED